MQNTINRLFEERAKKKPDNIAVEHANNHISYSELNNRANKLAHYLNNLGAQRETIIAICLERSIDIIIGMLGTLKTGGAYILIDPIYPLERIDAILHDSKPKILITFSKFLNRFSKFEGIAVRLDQIKTKKIPDTNPADNNVADNLAYIIYTSGTSGKPKGVSSSHAAILNRFSWMWDKYPFKPNDVFGQKTSPNFVDFIWESFGPLLQGIKSFIIDRNIINDHRLLTNCIQKHQISHLVLVPSLVEQFIFNNQHGFLSSLKQLTLSGEKLNAKLARKLKDINSNSIILNLYGSSEVAADATCCDIEQVNRHNRSIIGTPIANMHVHVLDKHMNAVKQNEIGEIYVSGIGLARGYLNMPELTATKFLANPFYTGNQKEYQRLYRTGDLARYMPDGNLEYIGRDDTQIKIRGYRIELEEIAQILSNHPEIEYCTVVAQNHNHEYDLDNKHLVSYYLRKIHLDKSDNRNFINDWNTLYQSEYSLLDDNNFNNNLQLWKSSYTETYISKEEMSEWVHCTVKRIKDLSPKVVLEIGSGTGLILFNIIKNCDYYYAIDFSKKANNYVINQIGKLGYKDKITSIIATADNIPYHQIHKKHDTVIINSVTQYFPNLDYLSQVITKAIANLRGAGQIFIGDIRDFRLLKCFHYSIQKYKNKNYTKKQITYLGDKDKELLISPEYFIELQKVCKNISYVEILPKLSKANNEVNNYRYDVILHINKNTSDNQSQQIDVKDDTFVKILNLEQYVNLNNSHNILFIKYPNARVSKDYTEYLHFINDFQESAEYTRILSLEETEHIITSKGYRYKCYLDPLDPLYLNILAYRINKAIHLNYNLINRRSSCFANNPLATSKLRDNNFTGQLKEYLSLRLPEYMLPLYYIALETLPLTINGKLDKSMLPDLEFNKTNLYYPPQNETEHTLCKIYANVLGIPEDIMGILDAFFELGGNSLLAIRIINKINKALNINISLHDFFQKQTIRSLSNYISKIDKNVNFAILDRGTI
jgi:microcystin synthetase protein McyA